MHYHNDEIIFQWPSYYCTVSFNIEQLLNDPAKELNVTLHFALMAGMTLLISRTDQYSTTDNTSSKSSMTQGYTRY